jgi:hypothetical protein
MDTKCLKNEYSLVFQTLPLWIQSGTKIEYFVRDLFSGCLAALVLLKYLFSRNIESSQVVFYQFGHSSDSRIEIGSK